MTMLLQVNESLSYYFEMVANGGICLIEFPVSSFLRRLLHC
jgi:hypothetical protein